jgi:PmbA protein
MKRVDREKALLQLGEQVVERALRGGADVAEAVVSESVHLSAKVRLGEPELLEEAASRSVGLRVMRGQQVAVAATSDLTEASLDGFVEDTIELATLAQPDPFAGPPSRELLSKSEEHPDLDLYDPSIDAIDADYALAQATLGERVALASDPRLTNSEGATFSRVSGGSALVTNAGFRGAVWGTYVSFTVSPVADEGAGGKKRSGYAWSASRRLADLESAEAVGKEAARNTIAKLGARKIDTQEVAVIFEPEAARSILGLLASCVVGGAIWRKSSYLVGREGQHIASELITVDDDPLLARRPGSRPFDGEGLKARRNVVVENGVLKSYLLDTYSGRKLERPSTGNASRGGGASVGASTTNFVLQPGKTKREQLIADTSKALYVTDMMGFGFNPVTGDFSRGASGFWVERGQIAFPVSEVTISLNLDQLFKRIDVVCDDLDQRAAIASPTFRVSAMTVGGR